MGCHVTIKKHISENRGSYVGILAVFPFIFAANLAMPDAMRLATYVELTDLRCDNANLMEELAGGNVARYTKEAGDDPSVAEIERISKTRRNLSQAIERKAEYC